jgi:hypothetical protein
MIMFRQFKTNKRLWLGIWAALLLMYFVFGHDPGLNFSPFGPVSTPELGGARQTQPTIAAELWEDWRQGHIDFGLLTFLGFFFLLWPGIPLLIIGWFIHAFILVIWEYVKTRK